jgi:hypothetical protein
MVVEQINIPEAWKPQKSTTQQQQRYIQGMTSQGNFNGGPLDDGKKANGQGR